MRSTLPLLSSDRRQKLGGSQCLDKDIGYKNSGKKTCTRQECLTCISTYVCIQPISAITRIYSIIELGRIRGVSELGKRREMK